MAISDSNHTVKWNRRFIAAAMRVPLVSQEHEADLARRWRGQHDEAALHELVSAYMRLVISTAGRFRNYGLPMGDLIQEGNVGLMQAAARFEPEREVRFSTYASWWIRSAMQEYVLRNWSIVRTGTSAAQKSLFFNLRWLRAKIDNGAVSLSPEVRNEIAARLRVKAEDVAAMANRMSGPDQSLNGPVGEEGGDEWGDFLADGGPTPEDLVLDRLEEEVRGRWLDEALSRLTEREQLIIRERRLKDDNVTLEELGQRLGITKERVRQIEHKAVEKLRANVLRISDGGVPGGALA